MSVPAAPFRYVSSDRRVREDRRFVVGKGRFAADVALPGTRHVALVTCPYPAARIVAIDKAEALSLPGVHYVLDGRELAAATLPLAAGLDTPHVPRRPLAVDVARYAGEWVAAVVADTRALAEDAAEAVAVEYEPLPFVLDGEEAYAPGSPLVHADHGSNVLLDRTFVWGEVEKDFADSPHRLSFKVKWGRSSTVPIETFGVLASWDPWREILDVWASVQMPRYPDQIAAALKLPGSAVRVYNDVDVGGSYGVKRGIKHTVLVGYLSRRLGFPVRLIEDRLENMRGGDAHGPERNFDIEVAFDDTGVVRSMKMRALDNVGAYAGRSPFQLGKPISAIVGPYRINSVQYRAIAVTSNKTVQEAVRAFGQSPTNFAIERMIEEVANRLGLDRLEVRRRNLIRAEQFPYLIPSGTTYDSGDYHAVIDKVLARADYARPDRRARPPARAGAARRHRHRRLPRAERRQLDLRAAAQSEEHQHHLHGFLPHQRRRERRRHRQHPYAVGRAGARDPGRHRDRRGAGDRSRPHPRGAARLALVAAEPEPGRQPHGDHAGRRRLPRRAEAQSEARRDRGARPRHSGRARDLCAPATCSTAARRRRGARGSSWCRSPTAISTGCRPTPSRGSRSRTCCRCRPAEPCRPPTAACRCIRASRSSSI